MALCPILDWKSRFLDLHNSHHLVTFCDEIQSKGIKMHCIFARLQGVTLLLLLQNRMIVWGDGDKAASQVNAAADVCKHHMLGGCAPINQLSFACVSFSVFNVCYCPVVYIIKSIINCCLCYNSKTGHLPQAFLLFVDWLYGKWPCVFVY